MKKVIALFLLLTALSASPSFAQLGLGITAGLNFANLVGDDVESSDGIMGWNVGVFWDLGMGEMFKVRPELLYSQKGSNAILPETFGAGSQRALRLNYLELPILFKLNMPVGPLGINVFAGPYVAHLLNVTDGTGDEDENALKELNRFDWGGVAGVGVDYESPIGLMHADARYSMGLQNIDREGNDDVRNNVAQVNIGWGF